MISPYIVHATLLCFSLLKYVTLGNSPLHTNDEEAFINFVKEFKYTHKRPSSDRQRTPSLHTDDDDGDNSPRASKRQRKSKDDDEAKAWETNFAKLVDYRERFGNCYVPYDWNEGLYY